MRSQNQPDVSITHLSDKLFEKLDTHRLPVLNRILIEILDCCEQQDMTFEQLEEVINKDAGFSARILSVANSAAYAASQPCENIARALSMLGLKAVRTLAITASIQQVLGSIQVEHSFDLNLFWKRSLMCGFLTRGLAGLIGHEQVEQAYLAGLLHQLGRLILAANFPGECSCLRAVSSEDLYRIERSQFGFNSCDVGGWLVRQWGLAGELSDAIRDQQENEERIRDAHPLSRLVFLSSRLCEESSWDQEYLYLALAEHLFGLTTSLVRKLQEEAREQMQWVANSMSIDTLDNRRVPDTGRPRSLVEPAVRDWPADQAGLMEKVRRQSLIDSLNPLLQSAREISELSGYLQVCGYVLFGYTGIILFVPDSERKVLLNKSATRSGFADSSVHIDTNDPASVIAKAYRENRPVKTVSEDKGEVSSTQDQRVSAACSGGGLVCIPVKCDGKACAVVVTGLQVLQLPDSSRQLRQMQEVVNLAGKYLVNLIESGPEEGAGAINVGARDASAIRRLVHEANNPLTILKNYIQVLGARDGGRDDREFGIVSAEIDRVGRIIRRISEESDGLAAAHPDSTEPSRHDVSTVVRDLVELCRDSFFIPQSVSVRIQDDGRALEIPLDLDAFKQILVNLIRNSVEALGDSGKLKITIQHDIIARERHFVEIVIADNGPGIPDGVLDRLYKPVESLKGRNRGIGLVIVKNLVRELGGFIHCKTRVGRGTSFQLLLPHED